MCHPLTIAELQILITTEFNSLGAHKNKLPGQKVASLIHHPSFNSNSKFRNYKSNQNKQLGFLKFKDIRTILLLQNILTSSVI